MEHVILVFVLYLLNYVLSLNSFVWDTLPQSRFPSLSSKKVQEVYIKQIVDHFNKFQKRFWSQRYWTNAYYYRPGSEVVFLMIGGKTGSDATQMKSGMWIEWAEMYGALMVQVEHRYYGKSQPFKDLSNQNLKYLTSHQALEDLQNIIRLLNEAYNFKNPKWIAIGGSYAGSLAVWIRLKYPILVQGSVCFSGLLLAKVEFPEYADVVVQNLAAYSQACVDCMKKALEQVERYINSPGEVNVTNAFQLCDEVNSLRENDKASLINVIFEKISIVSEQSSYRNITNTDICDMMTRSKEMEVYRLAKVVRLLMVDETCLNYKYTKIISDLKKIQVTQQSQRQWTFQMCNEFGWFHTSSKGGVFGGSMTPEYFLSICQQTYGSQYTPDYIYNQVKKTNEHYGGLKLEVRNVIFIQGSQDPWHPVGLTKTIVPRLPVIFVKGVGHFTGLNFPNPIPPQLISAKKEMEDMIEMYIRGKKRRLDKGSSTDLEVTYYANGHPALNSVNIFFLHLIRLLVGIINYVLYNLK